VALRPARRAACLWGVPWPLEGAGLVVWFVGCPTLPSRPVELHPRCKLLITPIFQNFPSFEIDLHGCCLSSARRAPLRVSKTSTVFFQGVFLRAVCCSGAPAGLGQSSRARMPAPGGSRRYARRPWPRSGRLLRHLCCASSLRRGANAEGAGVKAAQHRAARGPALTQERPAHYIALPWKEEAQRRSNGQR
jgi:hypothetical protein